MIRPFRYFLLIVSLLSASLFSSHILLAQDRCTPELPPILTHPSWNELSLIANDKTLKTQAANYLLDSKGRPRAAIKDLALFLLQRSPQRQQTLGRLITVDHARHEMSFRVKDELTGLYQRQQAVPVNGMVAPYPQEQFDQLMQSTGPVMRALRGLLQKIYSRPPQELNAQTLELTHLPREEQTALIDAIKNSLYYNKKIHHQALKDYPFLSIAGFDAAISDPEKSDATFFEYNLGTPSGLSNNIQLLQSLQEMDPELFQQLLPFLSQDHTFSQLKEVIQSNALDWTKNPQGIAVIVGPGVYNGAHPDVAAIAMMSGMPLVEKRDLYQDREGQIRLNLGHGKEHPVVTGIYSRAEESFLQGENPEDFPLVSPHYRDIDKLGKKLGHSLHPGIHYEFIYGKSESGEPDFDQIIGVQTDAAGNPKLARYYDQLGLDPSDPNAKRGDLMEAITKRKLYFSALGGRTVDDKKIFQVVHDYLSEKKPGQEIAHPPRTLELTDYSQLYQASEEELARYVVKVTDSSGGDGVYLLVNLPYEERKRIVMEVKKHPYQYIVQEFKHVAVMSTPHEVDEEGSVEWRSQANDWRLFPMMDASGQIRYSVQSILLRNASVGQAKTNTSAGGGYGIGVVLSEKPADPLTHILPRPPVHPYLAESRRIGLVDFLNYFNTVAKWAAVGPALSGFTLDQLIQKQRFIMEILGRDFAYLMSDARDLLNKKIDLKQFQQKMETFRKQLLDHDRYPVKGTRKLVKLLLNDLSGEQEITFRDFCTQLDQISQDLQGHESLKSENLQSMSTAHEKVLPLLGEQYRPMLEVWKNWEQYSDSEKLLQVYQLRNQLYAEKNFALPQLAQKARLQSCLGGHSVLREKSSRPPMSQEYLAAHFTFSPSSTALNPTPLRVMGHYTDSTDPFVRAVIAEIKQLGGSVQLRREFAWDEGQNQWCGVKNTTPFFHVNDEGVPNICLDLSAPYALSALAHEHQHLQHWNLWRKHFLKQGASGNELSARLMARNFLLRPELRVLDERRSVNAEMAAEELSESVFNRGSFKKVSSGNDPQIIARKLYPEIEGLREMLYRKQWAQKVKIKDKTVKKLLRKILHQALTMRKQIYQYHHLEAQRLKEGNPLESAKSLHVTYQLMNQDLFDLIFHADIENFKSNQTLFLLRQYFLQELGQVDLPNFQLDSNDDFAVYSQQQ